MGYLLAPKVPKKGPGRQRLRRWAAAGRRPARGQVRGWRWDGVWRWRREREPSANRPLHICVRHYGAAVSTPYPRRRPPRAAHGPSAMRARSGLRRWWKRGGDPRRYYVAVWHANPSLPAERSQPRLNRDRDSNGEPPKGPVTHVGDRMHPLREPNKVTRVCGRGPRTPVPCLSLWRRGVMMAARNPRIYAGRIIYGVLLRAASNTMRLPFFSENSAEI